MARARKQQQEKTNLEVADDAVDLDEVDDDEVTDDNNENESEDEMATAKAKARERAAEVEEEEDDVADEDEVDEEAEEESGGFSPYLYTGEETGWTLEDLFKEFEESEGSEEIIIYDAENERWWRLQQVKVGVLPEE